MKRFHIILSLTLLCAFPAVLTARGAKDSAPADTGRSQEVIAYTYDSFAGEWGPGPELCRLFAEKTGLTLTLIDCGDAVDAYSRALREKGRPGCDLVIGLDNALAPEALESGLLEPYVPRGRDDIIDADIRRSLAGGDCITPYDYGYFALIYDSESSVPAPRSLRDLTGEAYRKKLILMDPRTSTPGLGFVSWTRAVLGEEFEAYWKALAPSILTVSPGWSAGWGMFLAGEAPLVVSYNTSPAYTVEYEHNARYVTLIFDEGHVMQVEGAALVRGAANAAGARAFLDFLISEEAQAVLPLTQWMYPVNKRVSLPESYGTAAPLPARTLTVPATDIPAAVDAAVRALGE